MPEVNKSVVTTEVYTPESLVHIITNSIKPTKTDVLILLRGVYKPHGHIAYQQYYYDRIEDETSDYLLTIRLQRALRQTLNEGQTYLFKGYLTRQVRKEGRIELLYNVVDAVQQAPKLVSNAAEKQVRIYQRKLELGRRDVARILQNRLRQSTMARIALIIGQQSVIENDIRSALDDTLPYYELNPFRVNLGTAEELIQQIEKIEHSSYDLIAVARGGGAGQEIFDDEELAYIVAGLQTPLITAIGHADDSHLIDRIADKSFATPSQLGTFLKAVVVDLENEAPQSQPADATATDLSKQVQRLQVENKHLLVQLQQARAENQATPAESSLAPYVLLAIALGFGLGVYLV
jgi:hypothetical protein